MNDNTHLLIWGKAFFEMTIFMGGILFALSVRFDEPMSSFAGLILFGVIIAVFLKAYTEYNLTKK